MKREQNTGRIFEKSQQVRTKKERQAEEEQRAKRCDQIKKEAGGMSNFFTYDDGNDHDNDSDKASNNAQPSRGGVRRPIAELETRPSYPTSMTRATLPTPPPSAVSLRDGSEIELAHLRTQIDRQKDRILDLQSELETERTERQSLQERERKTRNEAAQAIVDGSSDEIKDLNERLRALGAQVKQAADREKELQDQVDEGRRSEEDLKDRLRQMAWRNEDLAQDAARAWRDRETDTVSLTGLKENSFGTRNTSGRRRGPYISVPRGEKRHFFPIV